MTRPLFFVRVLGSSVQEAVRRVLASNRSVYDCLRMGLINYTALAARIRPEVERLAGGQVNPNTIVVAVKRYADALGGADAGGLEGMAGALRNARISLTGGIMDMRLDADWLGHAGGMSGVIERISRVTSDFDLFRLPGLTRLAVEDLEGARSVVQSIPGGGASAVHTGLVRVRITVPGDVAVDAGALVVDLLHRNGIGYVDAYLGGEGMVITLDEEDAARAYDALRAEMSGGGRGRGRGEAVAGGEGDRGGGR